MKVTSTWQYTRALTGVASDLRICREEWCSRLWWTQPTVLCVNIGVDSLKGLWNGICFPCRCPWDGIDQQLLQLTLLDECLARSKARRRENALHWRRTFSSCVYSTVQAMLARWVWSLIQYQKQSRVAGTNSDNAVSIIERTVCATNWPPFWSQRSNTADETVDNGVCKLRRL